MKVAILGGSFNPIHLGHLFVADRVLSAFGYDRLILVPAFQSPFKAAADTAAPADRLDMLIASITADPRITVDDCEIRREGISYTIDTIADILARYRPEGKPALVLGDDLARGFDRWRNAPELAALADVVIAHRLSAGDIPFPFPHRRLRNEIMDLSSGMVRERIRQGGNWRSLVPEGARLIIEDRRLYGASPAGPPPDPSAFPPVTWELIARVESAARSALSPGRFLHSRNTALLSHDLALQFGLDPAGAYLAGIAHDICKSLPGEELTRLAKKDKGGISELERKKPSLLHARAGAVMLRDRFCICHEDILEAVRFHTTGDMAMGPLAKIVYIADKIEPSREQVDRGLREFRNFTVLDRFFEAVLGETVAYLNSRKMDISGGTKRLLAAIRKRSGE
ncbi:MAG: nicotinate (nicotinamide) nucleotide adenylyltransferase [Spirochaetaceae bacterium]|jgi:nicotinate-nucleotide adenylyltransferase|nr:nicotinate (nicotinamide) nucleotide adenylyltransferase [Spirochaetaceae bacterium]